MKALRLGSLACVLLLILSILTGCCCCLTTPHEHSYGVWQTTTKATCTKDGEQTRTCECGEAETQVIPATGHNYQFTKEVAADCSDTGSTTYTCTMCRNTKQETIPQTTYTATEIHDMYENIVGEVITYDKSGDEYALGSCFAISADGKVVTNYHVIEGAYSAKITIASKTYPVQKVLAYDIDRDIAVLKINATGLTPATLCSKTHKSGETVYAYGSSRGLTDTFSNGMISTAQRELDGVMFVQHTAAISSGNSGGPLINIYGEVIGINTLTVRDSQNLNFAVALTEMDALSYSNPMTMAQVYDKECNVYKKLVNYITSETTLDDNCYFVTLGTQYSSDYSSRYSVFACYYPADGEIWIGMTVDSDPYVYFIVDENVDGVYSWGYFDDYDYKMSGTLYASTYDSDTLLGYSYNNLSTSSLRTSVRKLASSMMDYTISNLTEYFSDANVTAKDLGFSYYS